MGFFSRKKKSSETKNEKGSLNTQLTEAVAHEKTEKVKSVLEQGAEIDHINSMGITALQYACNQKSKEMVTLLINRGADLFVIEKESGFTLLHTAAFNGYLWLVKILVEKGLDVNARDKEGNGPLWRAGNKHEIGTYLMENGADPKMENHQGNSPFNSNAVAFDYIKDPKKKDDRKRTDNIFEAIEKKDLTSIALLTVKKYDFNQLNEDGKTPLIYAVENDYADIILLLIKNGAKTNLTDSDGNTPLSIAQHMGHKEIEKILTEYDN
jgi:ankyrin repeat protein